MATNRLWQHIGCGICGNAEGEDPLWKSGGNVTCWRAHAGWGGTQLVRLGFLAKVACTTLAPLQPCAFKHAVFQCQPCAPKHAG